MKKLGAFGGALIAATSIMGTQANAQALTFDADGYIRLGYNYNSDREDETVPEFRLRVQPIATLAVTEDLSFGFGFQYQVDENYADGRIDFKNAQTNVPYVFARYEKYYAAFGNTDGAINRIPFRAGYEPGVTYPFNQASAVNFRYARLSWSGEASDVLYLGYGGFRDPFRAGVSISTEDRQIAPGGFETFDEEWSAYVSNGGDNYQLSIGYAEGREDQSLVMATAQYTLGDLSLSALLAQDDVEDESLSGTAYGMSARWQVSEPVRIEATYANGTADNDTEAYGVGASYQFENGISLRSGVFQQTNETIDRQIADIGLIYFF
ncbi:porin [Pseudoroseicyclus aestuarii]|nr:porin [Pseudoroseicyclus aestuarii]